MSAEPHIELVTTVPSQDEVFKLLTPPVKEWITDAFGSLNEVQQMAIPRIVTSQNTLVMAPTGSGKTLAAFLGIISELQRLESQDQLEKKIYCLYISPLKALNNDIHKNLEVPLEEIQRRSGSRITVAKRTGDTTTKERAQIARSPPHILITTPESLGLMLAAPKFKEKLRDIRWLIVDEIHSIADNKRGTHLSLSLERLEFYLARPLTRIGLSATVEPPELVGQYLVGQRSVNLGIIDQGDLRQLDLEVITPTRNLVSAPFSLIERNQMNYLLSYLEQNRTILVFTNTRHMAERLSIELQDQVDEEFKDKIAVHHGSLDKEVRLAVENRLKQGEMKAVFTSTSLEMGIDIGSIDLTVQLGSPKTVRALLQRIGRSGHSQNLISRGKILVFNRDDLIECIALSKLALEGRIDAIRVPEAPADVLIQIIVGMALEQKWNLHDAYTVVSSAYPYRDMNYDDFLKVLRTAADPTKNEDSWKYGHIWLDEEIEEFGRRKSARQSYLQNIGTIPDSTTINVVLQGFRTTIGQIAEKFAERLQENDIFVLGGKSYQFVRAVGNKILVDDAPGRVPTVPSWGGEAQTRTIEVSQEIDHLLSTVEQLLDQGRGKAVTWVMEEYPVGVEEAEAAVDYIIEQQGIAPLPLLNRIPVETYVDPSGALNILFLMIFGLETNQALAQALGHLVSQQVNNNIGTLAMDNGVLLRIPPGLEIDHTQLLQQLTETDLKTAVMQPLRNTEMFKTRFRQAAARALMILRKWGRKNIPVSQQQRTSHWLLRHLDDQMVVVAETYREIMYDTYNLLQAQHVVDMIQSGDITILPQPPAEVPSSFTHAMLLNGELDVVLMDDRRSLLASLHQQVLSRLLPELAEYSSILKKEEVDLYFASKFADTVDLHTRLLNWAELPIPSQDLDPLEHAKQWLHLDIDEIKQLLDEHEDIIELPSGGYTSFSQLPMLAAISGDEFWQGFDGSQSLVEIAQERATELSPELAWEHLILKVLEFNGPLSFEELLNHLSTTPERVEAVIRRLQRNNIILKGNFTADYSQYLRAEDREFLNRADSSQQITDDHLKNYRLYKMRLLKRNQSAKISILDYLRENGPAREPIELVARLPSFSWTDLRVLLSNRDAYFGRFLGRRLVFIHHDYLEDLVRITRDPKQQLTDTAHAIMVALAERPGLTQKELGLTLNLPNSVISEAINLLEDQLYISRTGFELTLSHGGFPNPRYISLPHVVIDQDNYQLAVINILERCCQWYGPLTLNDFLRITRLPYNIIEEGLKQSELVSKLILNTNYYGHDYNFEVLESFSIDPAELEEIYLLSPLDPYFYMTSGSFRRDFLPRQTRLSIIHEGLPKGHVELSIPDKDMLQVINLQISKRRRSNTRFIQSIGIKLRDLGKSAYQTPVIFIEEIGYHPADHADNALVVSSLEEIGYQLFSDHLVSGTGKNHEFSQDDVYATRQIHRKLRQEQEYTDLSQLFKHHPVISSQSALQMLRTENNRSQLLLSHHLRKGSIHYHGGNLYRDDIHRLLYPRNTTVDSPLIALLKNPKSKTELLADIDMTTEELVTELQRLVQQQVIEQVSPYSKTREYRLLSSTSSPLASQLRMLISYIVETRGPLSFQEILDELTQYLDTSRTQLLTTLTDLLQERVLSSASIRKGNENLRLVMYFTSEQADILGDPSKSRYFNTWSVYSHDDKIFDLHTADDHVVVRTGKLVASFKYKRQQDKGIIENLNLLNLEHLRGEFMDLMLQIEQFVLKKGMKRLEIRRLGGAIPNYWVDLQ